MTAGVDGKQAYDYRRRRSQYQTLECQHPETEFMKPHKRGAYGTYIEYQEERSETEPFCQQQMAQICSERASGILYSTFLSGQFVDRMMEHLALISLARREKRYRHDKQIHGYQQQQYTHEHVRALIFQKLQHSARLV